MFNNTFDGLTAEEYSDVLGMCVNWYKFETTLFNNADKDDRLKSAYYNIVSLDPFNLKEMNRVLQITEDARTVSRLNSIFQGICIRLGDKTIKKWTDAYVKRILSHPDSQYTNDDTDTLFRRHPYVILIPMLTLIFIKDMSTE